MKLVMSAQDAKKFHVFFPIQSECVNPKRGERFVWSIPRKDGYSIFLKGIDTFKKESEYPVMMTKVEDPNKKWEKYQMVHLIEGEGWTIYSVRIEVMFKTQRINVFCGGIRVLRLSFKDYSDISLKNICRVADVIYDVEGNPTQFTSTFRVIDKTIAHYEQTGFTLGDIM